MNDLDQGIIQELIPSEFVEPTETEEIKEILEVVQDSVKEDGRETEDTVSAEIDVLKKEMADVDEDSKRVIDQSDDDKEKPKSPKAEDMPTDEKEKNVGEGQNDVSSIIEPKSEILQNSASLEQTDFIGNDEEIAKESSALAKTEISGKDIGDADETAREDTKIGEADVLVQETVDVEDSDAKDLGQIGEDKLQPIDSRLDIDQSRQERTDDQQPSSESCDQNESDTQERTISDPTETIQIEKGGIIVPDVSSRDLTNEIDGRMKGDPESDLIGNEYQTGNESIQPDDTKQESTMLTPDEQKIVKGEETAKESNVVAEGVVSDPEKEITVIDENAIEDIVSAEMGVSNRKTVGTCEGKQEDTVSAGMEVLDNEYADIDESREKVLSQNDENNIEPTQNTQEMTEKEEIREIEQEAQGLEKENEPEKEASVDEVMNISGNKSPDGGKLENVDSLSTDMNISEKDKAGVNEESEKVPDQCNEDKGSIKSVVSQKVKADVDNGSVNDLDQGIEQGLIPSEFVEPTETDEIKEILEVVQDSVKEDGRETEDIVSAEIDVLNKEMADVDEDIKQVIDQSDDDKEKPKLPKADDIETDEKEENVEEGQNDVSSIIEPKSEILQNSASWDQTEFVGNDEGIAKESSALAETEISGKDMGDADETAREDTKIGEADVLVQETIDVEDSDEKDLGQIVEDKLQPTDSRLDIDQSRQERTDNQQPSSESCDQNESDTQERTISDPTETIQIEKGGIIVPDVSSRDLTNEIDGRMKGDPDSDLIGNEYQTGNESIQPDDTKQESTVLTPDEQKIVKGEETAKESNIVAEGVVSDPEKEITFIDENAIEDIDSPEMGVSNRKTVGTCEGKQEDTVSAGMDVLDNEYADIDESREKVLRQNDKNKIEPSQNTQEMTEEEEIREIEQESQGHENENEPEKEASADEVMNISGNKSPDGGKLENVDSLSTDMNISEKDKADVNEESEKVPDQYNEDIGSIKSDVSQKVKADVDDGSANDLDQGIEQGLIPSEFVEPTETDEIKEILEVVQDSVKEDGRETEDIVSAEIDVLNKEMADVDEDIKQVIDQSDDDKEKPKLPKADDIETDEKEENVEEGQNDVSSIIEPKSEILQNSASSDQTEFVDNDEGIAKESSVLAETEISGKDMGDADETAREDTKIGEADVLVQETIDVEGSDEKDLGHFVEDKLQQTDSRLDIDQSRQERTDDQQPSSESCDQNESDTQERTISEPTEAIQIQKEGIIVPDFSNKDLLNEIDERMKGDTESDLIGNEFQTVIESVQPDDTKQETRVLTPDEQNIRKEEETAKKSNIVAEGVVSDPEKEITVINENANEDLVSAEMGISDRKTVGTCEGKQEDTVSAEMEVLDNEYADIDESREKMLSQNDENNIEPTQNTQEMTEEEEIREIEEEAKGYEKENEPEKKASVDEVTNVSGNKSPDGGKLENIDSLSTDMNISEKDKADENEESKKVPDQSNEDIGSIKSDVSEKVNSDVDDDSVNDLDQGIIQELIPSEFVEPTETEEIKEILEVVQDSVKEDGRETEDTVSAEIDVLNKEMADVDEDSKQVIVESNDDSGKPKSPKPDDIETDEKEENIGEGQNDVSSIIEPKSEILQNSASLEQAEYIGNDDGIAKESSALAETEISGKDMGDADETAREDTKIGEADVLVQETVDVEDSEENDLGQIGEDKLQPTDSRLDIDQSRQERTDDQQQSSDSCGQNESDTQERTISEPTETIQIEKGGINVPDVSSKDLTNEIDEHMKGDTESDLIGNEFQTGNESIQPDDTKQETRVLTPDEQTIVKEEETAKESNIVAEGVVSDPEKEITVINENANEDVVSAEMGVSNRETVGTFEGKQEDTVSAEMNEFDNEYADIDESREKMLSQNDENNIEPTQNTQEMTEEEEIREIEDEAQGYEKENEPEKEASVDEVLNVSENKSLDAGKLENVDSLFSDMKIIEKDKSDVNEESEKVPDQSNENIASIKSDVSEKDKADVDDGSVNDRDQGIEQKELIPSVFVEPTETDEIKEILEVVQDSVKQDGRETEDTVSAEIDVLNKEMADVDEDSKQAIDQSDDDKEKSKSPKADDIETDEKEENIGEGQNDVSSIIEPKSEILQNSASLEQTEFIGDDEGIAKESSALAETEISDKDMGAADETAREDTKLGKAGIFVQETVDVEDSNEKDLGQLVEDKLQQTDSRLDIDQSRQERTDDQQPSSESCDQNESDTQERTISEPTETIQIEKGGIIVPDVSSKDLLNEIDERMKGDPESDLIGNEFQTGNESIQPDDTKQETRVLTHDEQTIVKEKETAKESNIVAEGVVSDPEKEITVINENANEDVVSAEMGVSDRKTVGTSEGKQEDTVSAEMDVLDNEYADIDESCEKMLSQNDENNIEPTQNTQEMTEEEEIRQIEEEAKGYEKENEPAKEATVDEVTNVSVNKSPDGGKLENVVSISTDMNISEKDRADVNEESEKVPDQSNEDIGSIKPDVSDGSLNNLDQGIEQELIPSEFVEPTETEEIKEILEEVQDSVKEDGSETEDTVSAEIDVLNKEMADVDEGSKQVIDQSDDDKEKPKSPKADDIQTDEKEENVWEGQNDVSSIIEPTSEILQNSASLEQTDFIGNDEEIAKESSALAETEISGKDMGDADETAREDTKIGEADVLVQETVDVEDSDEKDLGQIGEDKLQPTDSRLDIDQSRQERTDDQLPSSESCDQNESDTQERTICGPTETIQIEKGVFIVPDVSSKYLTNEIDERITGDPDIDLIGNEFLTGNEPIQPDDSKQETRVLTPDEQNIMKEEEPAKESNIVEEGVVSDPEKEITVINENANEDVVSAEMGVSDRKTVGTCEGKQEDTVFAEMDVLDNEYADIDESREKVLSQNVENNIEPTQNTQEMTEEEEIREIEEEAQGYVKEIEPEKEASVDEVTNHSGNKSPDGGKLENEDSISTDMNILEKDKADINEESEKAPDQSNEDIGSIKSDVSENVKSDVDDGSVNDHDQGIEQELIPSEFVGATETDEIKEILEEVQDSVKEDGRETEDTVSADIDVLNKEMADVDEDSKRVIDQSDDDKEKPKSPKAEDMPTDEKEKNVGEGQNDVSSIIEPKSEILQTSASLEQTELIGNDEGIAKESSALAETEISCKGIGDADETAREDTKIGEADVLVQETVDVEDSEEKDLGQIGEDKLQPTDSRLDIDQSRQERTDDQQSSSESCDQNESDTQERTISEPTETVQIEKGGIIVPDVSNKDLTNEIHERMKGDPESDLIGNEFQTGNESIQPDDTKHLTRVLTPDDQNIVKEEETAKESNIVEEGVVSDPEKEITVINENANEDVVSAETGVSDGKTVGTYEGKQKDAVFAEMDVLDNAYADIDESREKVLSQNDENNIEPTQNTQKMTKEEEIREIEEEAQGYEKENEPEKEACVDEVTNVSGKKSPDGGKLENVDSLSTGMNISEKYKADVNEESEKVPDQSNEDIGSIKADVSEKVKADVDDGSVNDLDHSIDQELTPSEFVEPTETEEIKEILEVVQDSVKEDGRETEDTVSAETDVLNKEMADVDEDRKQVIDQSDDDKEKPKSPKAEDKQTDEKEENDGEGQDDVSSIIAPTSEILQNSTSLEQTEFIGNDKEIAKESSALAETAISGKDIGDADETAREDKKIGEADVLVQETVDVEDSDEKDLCQIVEVRLQPTDSRLDIDPSRQEQTDDQQSTSGSCDQNEPDTQERTISEPTEAIQIEKAGIIVPDVSNIDLINEIDERMKGDPETDLIGNEFLTGNESIQPDDTKQETRILTPDEQNIMKEKETAKESNTVEEGVVSDPEKEITVINENAIEDLVSAEMGVSDGQTVGTCEGKQEDAVFAEMDVLDNEYADIGESREKMLSQNDENNIEPTQNTQEMTEEEEIREIEEEAQGYEKENEPEKEASVDEVMNVYGNKSPDGGKLENVDSLSTDMNILEKDKADVNEESEKVPDQRNEDKGSIKSDVSEKVKADVDDGNVNDLDQSIDQELIPSEFVEPIETEEIKEILEVVQDSVKEDGRETEDTASAEIDVLNKEIANVDEDSKQVIDQSDDNKEKPKSPKAEDIETDEKEENVGEGQNDVSSIIEPKSEILQNSASLEQTDFIGNDEEIPKESSALAETEISGKDVGDADETAREDTNIREADVLVQETVDNEDSDLGQIVEDKLQPTDYRIDINQSRQERIDDQHPSSESCDQNESDTQEPTMSEPTETIQIEEGVVMAPDVSSKDLTNGVDERMKGDPESDLIRNESQTENETIQPDDTKQEPRMLTPDEQNIVKEVETAKEINIYADGGLADQEKQVPVFDGNANEDIVCAEMGVSDGETICTGEDQQEVTVSAEVDVWDKESAVVDESCKKVLSQSNEGKFNPIQNTDEKTEIEKIKEFEAEAQLNEKVKGHGKEASVDAVMNASREESPNGCKYKNLDSLYSDMSVLEEYNAGVESAKLHGLSNEDTVLLEMDVSEEIKADVDETSVNILGQGDLQINESERETERIQLDDTKQETNSLTPAGQNTFEEEETAKESNISDKADVSDMETEMVVMDQEEFVNENNVSAEIDVLINETSHMNEKAIVDTLSSEMNVSVKETDIHENAHETIEHAEIYELDKDVANDDENSKDDTLCREMDVWDKETAYVDLKVHADTVSAELTLLEMKTNNINESHKTALNEIVEDKVRQVDSSAERTKTGQIVDNVEKMHTSFKDEDAQKQDKNQNPPQKYKEIKPDALQLREETTFLENEADEIIITEADASNVEGKESMFSYELDDVTVILYIDNEKLAKSQSPEHGNREKIRKPRPVAKLDEGKKENDPSKKKADSNVIFPGENEHDDSWTDISEYDDTADKEPTETQIVSQTEQTETQTISETDAAFTNESNQSTGNTVTNNLASGGFNGEEISERTFDNTDVTLSSSAADGHYEIQRHKPILVDASISEADITQNTTTDFSDTFVSLTTGEESANKTGKSATHDTNLAHQRKSSLSDIEDLPSEKDS